MVPRSIKRDVRALLDGFQRRRHRRATAADNGNMQSATVTTSLVAAT
jgi:hypothetical protein